MSAWTPGYQIGPYDLLSLIGAGGMGEVWKARDGRLDRTVAIKKLKENHGARFEQEARAIAALNHSNICQIYDVGTDYLVLEYIEGQPLKITRRAGRTTLSIELPFADRDDLELGRRGDELLVRVGPYRRAITLPDSLRNKPVADASLKQGRLKVVFEGSGADG